MLDVQHIEQEAGDHPASELAQALPLAVNVADEVLYTNVERAIAAGYDLIQAVPPHDGVALIVGGGPSAQDDVEDIRARHKAGATLFALNGAGLWLQRQNIVPDALFILDARPLNARFVEGLSPEVTLYLSTQCDAAVFEAGKHHKIVAWHPPLGKTIEDPRPNIMIGGSTCLGPRAMRAIHVLGFRREHLYGYDSSYRAGAHHAYPQAENDENRLEPARVGNRWFETTPWMIRQADDFQHIAAGLIEEGMHIHVHGDGLLPEVARQMWKVPPANVAMYDLNSQPASWDFVVWLITAEMDRVRNGITEPLEVLFATGSDNGFRSGDVTTHAQRQQMFDRVMRPALRLFNARETTTQVDGKTYSHSFAAITAAVRNGEKVPRLSTSLAYKGMAMRFLVRASIDAMGREVSPKNGTITITLREADYWTQRNSNGEAWVEFARKRRAEGYLVVFVRDTLRAEEPIEDFVISPQASRDLEFRAALYEMADCNLMLSNGPSPLLLFGSAPFLFFIPLNLEGYSPSRPEWWTATAGITPPAEQWPWLTDQQRMIWERDDLDAIERAWTEWKAACPSR